MGQKLSEQINRYFNLMEKIREQMYRVLPVSDRYLCIVSFSTQLQALQCVLVSKSSLMEAKLLEGLTGQELVTYGQYMRTAEEWVAGGMQDDYPFTQDKDVYAEYRSLTRDEQTPVPEMEDEEDLDEQELDNLRTSILCADKATLMQMYADEGLGTKGTAADMDVGQLQDVLCEHYGLNSDVDVSLVGTAEDEDEPHTVTDFSWASIQRMSRHEALAAVSALSGEGLKRVAQEAGVASDTSGKALRSLLKGRVLNL